RIALPLWIEEPALEGRARERARAGIAGGSQVGESLVAQHTAGEGAGVAGRSRARSRRRNDAVHLILRKHRLSRSGIPLCRRRSRAARLVLLSRPLLRTHPFLSSSVAAAASGRCRGGSRAWFAGTSQIFPLVWLCNSGPSAATGVAAADVLLRPRL